jgi:hypothetical protein
MAGIEGDRTAVEREIGELADLPRPDLVERWQGLHRAHPPKGISRRMLVRAIAYEMQAKKYGGLKPAVGRQLQKIANGLAISGEVTVIAKPKFEPGARLVREWNGRSHVVEVVEGGFVWNGDRHSSLSAIARAITGARWSGPRFFGLTSSGAS